MVQLGAQIRVARGMFALGELFDVVEHLGAEQGLLQNRPQALVLDPRAHDPGLGLP